MLPRALAEMNLKPNSEIQWVLLGAEQLIRDFPVNKKYFDNLKRLASEDEKQSMRTFLLWWREKNWQWEESTHELWLTDSHAIHYTNISSNDWNALI